MRVSPISGTKTFLGFFLLELRNIFRNHSGSQGFFLRPQNLYFLHSAYGKLSNGNISRIVPELFIGNVLE